MSLWAGVGVDACVVGVRVGDELHVLDEVSLMNSSTQRLADELKKRYPGRKVNSYPDPSGNSRKTSAGVGQTDFAILKAAGFQVIAPKKAPRVSDRINEVNAMFLNAKGEPRLFIHKRCQKLIHCLEGLTYREDTMEPRGAEQVRIARYPPLHVDRLL